jgi:hypothetical protein
MEITSALAAIPSSERRQPLDDTAPVDNADTTVRKHSMTSVAPAKHTGNFAWGLINGGDRTTGFTIWQPHFNRDFSSVYELLSVPVVGPDKLIAGVVDETSRQLNGWANSSVLPKLPFVAAKIIQEPDGDSDNDGTIDAGSQTNRWYRLFEFLEYPPRTQETVRDGISVRRRTDGRINLNTLRYEDVFAGLIDDDLQLINPWEGSGRSTADQQDNPARNWFDQLLQARDGLDPISGLPLPGVPGSMPFRSLSYMDPQENGGSTDHLLQNTILRDHLTTAGFGLFEARGSADIGTDEVDYHTRNRLLAKIANNSTNRSHVFAMWVGYELFEAHQPNADAVQIGARIDDLPGHREFVVVDMSRLEEAWVDDPNDGQPGRFDFRKFIIYRKRIK